MIADLEVSGGFRVSRSGTVQGYAQCLGDLNSGDCRQCVEVAVQQLKEACGSALAADVFLAKCYARYWASGYYTSSSSSGWCTENPTKFFFFTLLRNNGLFIYLFMT